MKKEYLYVFLDLKMSKRLITLNQKSLIFFNYFEFTLKKKADYRSSLK